MLQVFQIFLQMSSSQICLKKKLGVKWCMYITRVSTKNTNQTSL